MLGALTALCPSGAAAVTLAASDKGAQRLRSSFTECPLCVAEDNCHVACAAVKSRPPGSAYCLEACIGAHPGDNFGVSYFMEVDRRMQESANLDKEMQQLGQELASEVRRGQ